MHLLQLKPSRMDWPGVPFHLSAAFVRIVNGGELTGIIGRKDLFAYYAKNL